ncbi:hypothetical protein SUGI_0394680 [Cryptomeria japonica]|nr:hypothetical protein SUGI_0394680 [Cryptomeria japonica]
MFHVVVSMRLRRLPGAMSDEEFFGVEHDRFEEIDVAEKSIILPLFDSTTHSDEQDVDKAYTELLSVASHCLSQGMVGPKFARNVAGVILEMIQVYEQRICNGVILAGSNNDSANVDTEQPKGELENVKTL